MQTLKFLFGYAKAPGSFLIITVLSMFLSTAVQLVEPKIISEMIAIVKAPFVDGFSMCLQATRRQARAHWAQ